MNLQRQRLMPSPSLSFLRVQALHCMPPADARYVHVIANAPCTTACMRKHVVPYGAMGMSCTSSGLKDLIQAVNKLHLLGNLG